MSFFNVWWGHLPAAGTGQHISATTPTPTPPAPPKRTAGTLKLGVARTVTPTTTQVQEILLVRANVRETLPAAQPTASTPKKPPLTAQQRKDIKRAKADASRERSLHKGPASSMLMRRGIMIAAISGRKQHEARA